MNKRLMSIACVLSIVGLLLVSIYLQMYKNILPCPLCQLQRFTFIIIGILFALGAMLYRKIWHSIIIHSSTAIFSIIGMLLAGRQVWLQHFTSQLSAECAPSLQYMFQVLSWNEIFEKVLQGTSDCAKVEWEFLHFDMAEWALIWFMIYLLISLYLLLNKVK